MVLTSWQIETKCEISAGRKQDKQGQLQAGEQRQCERVHQATNSIDKRYSHPSEQRQISRLQQDK